jgi:alkanesulfonate monooxygenase SsuD/methylene tetrahydromethanopterin reductase-like flavin-dependent oxidoreductase (luciferase family)
MKLGIGLPNTLTPALNRGLFLDWARAADRGGFHVFGTIDQASYDSWDPLISLAAAAAVTERVRLATTVLVLPSRNEVTVAKQAAVIDRLSGGRLDLGLSVGKREADFKALGARFAGRGKKFERQVRKVRKIWRAAKKANETEGLTGPAPMQKPLPPIWIGGSSDAAVKRAVDVGDGYIFGTAGAEKMAQKTPEIRAMVEAAGKKNYQIAGLAYVAIGDDLAKITEAGERQLLRYYRTDGRTDVSSLLHAGPPDVIAQAVKEYEAAGLDILIVVPQIAEVRQVELLAEHVLPSYRVPVR